MIECPRPGTRHDAEELCWLISRVFFPNDIQPPTRWWALPDGAMSEACKAWGKGKFQEFVESIWHDEPEDWVKSEVAIAYTKFKLTGADTPVTDLQVDYSRLPK